MSQGSFAYKGHSLTLNRVSHFDQISLFSSHLLEVATSLRGMNTRVEGFLYFYFHTFKSLKYLNNKFDIIG